MQDFFGEALLGEAEFFHELGRDIGCELHGEVALLAVASQSVDRLHGKFQELIELVVRNFSLSLHDIAPDATDSTLRKQIDVFAEVFESDSACEDGGCSVLNEIVGELDAEEAVGHLHARKAIIYK